MSLQVLITDLQQSFAPVRLFPFGHYVDSASNIVMEYSSDDPSVPFSDQIVSIPDPDYILAKPIRVTIDYEEDYYIVSDDRFLRYGTGSTLAEAKKEYGYALVEYLDDLTELEDCLAPHLAHDLQELRNILIPSRPQA